MGKDSLEKRLRQIEELAKTGDKRPLTVYSEVAGQYFTLEGEDRVPVSRKELLRLKDSAIVTLVVMRDCEKDVDELGLFRISVVSPEGMMMVGRVLAGERTEKGVTDEEQS